MRIPAVILTILLLVPALSGCGPGTVTPGEVNVAAASSLKDVLNEIKGAYERNNPGIRLNFNFASSGTLANQIEHGARTDLFISAGGKQVNALKEKGLVEAPRGIAGNELVVVVPVKKKPSLTSLIQLTSADTARIAMGNPDTVPAGQYALEALTRAGILDAVHAKLVLTKDVRQVLAYVETGNVDAGFIYRSDALSSKNIKAVYTVPAGLYSPIIYPAALIKDSPNLPAAGEFLDFLQTEEARAIFKHYGFTEAP